MAAGCFLQVDCVMTKAGFGVPPLRMEPSSGLCPFNPVCSQMSAVSTQVFVLEFRREWTQDSWVHVLSHHHLRCKVLLSDRFHSWKAQE